jgi:hypothetical protein
MARNLERRIEWSPVFDVHQGDAELAALFTLAEALHEPGEEKDRDSSKGKKQNAVSE